MSTTSTTSTTPARLPGQGAGHPDRAVVRLAARLVRRPAGLLAASLAAYVALELVSYAKAYPDAASRARIATFGEVGAARALQGIPHGVQTAGGFVVWDGGWVLETIIGVWAILLAGRLLRGEEDDGRADWVLAGPVRASRILLLQLAVLVSAASLTAAAVTLTLILGGAELAGALLFGAGLACFAATFSAVTAVAAQVFGVRRRVTGTAGAVLGLSFVVRMVADSADSRGWLRMATPFGWLEELQPFAAQRWPVLGLLAVVPLVLGGAAVALRARRDLGGAVLGGDDRHAPRLGLLSSPEGYAWRSGRGVLLAWAVGLGAYGAVMGSLVRSMTDYLASDESLRKTMESLGMGLAVTADGFVGVMGVLIGVCAAVFGCWRVAAARAEEAGGRAELMLSRPVSRTRWLAGHAACAMVAVVAVLGASAVGLWLGAVMTGAGVSFGAALASAANTVPAAGLFLGMAVLTLAVLPRATAVLPVAFAVVSYLLQLIGPALELPEWVLNLSAFHHLAYVPAQPFAAGAAIWMAGIGLAAALAGLVAFQRRDVQGA